MVEGFVRSWDRSNSLRAFAMRLSLAGDQSGVAEEPMIGQFKVPPWSYGY